MTTNEAIELADRVKDRQPSATRTARARMMKLNHSRTDRLRKTFDGIADDVDHLRNQIAQIETDLDKISSAFPRLHKHTG